ncbi:MAG: hypothetical protein OXE53_18510 [Deltaproteobacteria bacterium]|nr:hypothetical protein [Deltaproteobacteria bacterium]
MRTLLAYSAGGECNVAQLARIFYHLTLHGAYDDSVVAATSTKACDA